MRWLNIDFITTNFVTLLAAISSAKRLTAANIAQNSAFLDILNKTDSATHKYASIITPEKNFITMTRTHDYERIETYDNNLNWLHARTNYPNGSIKLEMLNKNGKGKVTRYTDRGVNDETIVYTDENGKVEKTDILYENGTLVRDLGEGVKIIVEKDGNSRIVGEDEEKTTTIHANNAIEIQFKNGTIVTLDEHGDTAVKDGDRTIFNDSTVIANKDLWEVELGGDDHDEL